MVVVGVEGGGVRMSDWVRRRKRKKEKENKKMRKKKRYINQVR